MTPARPLGVAVVGLGVGEAHAWAYLDAGCRLVRVCDIDATRAARVAAALGAARAGSFEEILADPEVDAVSIASYDDAHFEQAVAALRAGKHVFCEKPLCRSIEELRALKAAWSASGRCLASNLVLRAAPAYRWLQGAIAAGELGEIYAYDGDYLYGRLSKITEGWRAGVEDYSVMLGGGIHLVDLMLRLLGRRPVSVTAVGNRICAGGSAFRYDDYVAATYAFEGGLVGRITANFGCVHRHQHVVRVFGTRATFVLDDAGPRLHTGRDDAPSVRRLDLSPLPSTKGALIPAFVDALRAGREAEPGAAHEFDVVSACVAAKPSPGASVPAMIEYA